MWTITGFRWLAVLIGFALVSGFSVAAEASPQALGLVASNGPLPLVCGAGECQAHLSAFCLQEARTIPPLGTSYRVATPASVKLVLTTADGRRVETPAAGTVSFTVYRGFTAIKASLPAGVLAAQGAVAAALEIERDALLIPQAEAGDPNPQTQADIELARKHLRPAAVAFFDAASPRADAARLVNDLINALPETGRAPALEDGALWSHAISPEAVAAAAPTGVQMAANIHQSCRTSRSLWQHYTMRRCLESAHAALMYDINRNFWDSLGES